MSLPPGGVALSNSRNDGDGLNSADAVALADALQAALDDGRVASWIAIRRGDFGSLPNEKAASASTASV